jgi:hypothetical protein
MTLLSFAGFSIAVIALFVGGVASSLYVLRLNLRVFGPCSLFGQVMGIDFANTVDRACAMLSHCHVHHGDPNADVAVFIADPCTIFVSDDPGIIEAIKAAIDATPGQRSQRSRQSPQPAMVDRPSPLMPMPPGGGSQA